MHGTLCLVWGRPEYIKFGILVGLATAVVQTQLFPVRSSCCFFYPHQLYCLQYLAADVFSVFGLSCTIVLFLVRSRCVFFFLPSKYFERQNIRSSGHPVHASLSRGRWCLRGSCLVAASLRRHVVIVGATQAVNQVFFFRFVPQLRCCY